MTNAVLGTIISAIVTPQKSTLDSKISGNAPDSGEPQGQSFGFDLRSEKTLFS